MPTVEGGVVTVIEDLPFYTTTITELYTGTSLITGPIAISTILASDSVVTIVMATPPVFSTRFYTGTSILSGPITVTTLSPSGSDPATVIIEKPPVTITQRYSGSSTVTLTKITPTATEDGTVIIGIPAPQPVTSYHQYSGSSSINAARAVTTIQPTDTEPATVVIETPAPPPAFSCDEGGYLIQVRTLYRLNLVTGVNSLVAQNVGPGAPSGTTNGGTINPIGYNVLDNLIYGIVQVANSKSQVIRIGSTGSYTLMNTFIDGSQYLPGRYVA
ncbi:hypothetical protein BKA60DRAFT_539499 [Fusarium oxysporum]|uniref:Uncharacterized protein n=1 Tax=Fusarium oxysporum TaxID=5507 RepID=A0A420N5I8_FUSOX|nr:hypothetical protein BKA60DRAFT_539499 [Fusarium oxysporum]RKK75461.1 hypothetical protein BFJ69_g7718 [Fusarium oxysporum]